MHRAVAVSMLLSLSMFVLDNVTTAQSKGKYICDEPNPQSLCTADNTCPASGPCTVDIKRTGRTAHGHSRLSPGQGKFPFLP